MTAREHIRLAIEVLSEALGYDAAHPVIAKLLSALAVLDRIEGRTSNDNAIEPTDNCLFQQLQTGEVH